MRGIEFARHERGGTGAPMSAVGCRDGRGRRVALLAAMIAWLGIVTAALAEDGAPPKPAASPADAAADAARLRREADDAPEIQRMAQYFDHVGGPFDLGPKEFCERFLSDLKQMRGIEFIEPIVRAESYDDPKLRAYRNKCPKLQFNKAIMPGDVADMDSDFLDEHGYAYYASRNLKLFKMNVDNVRYVGGRGERFVLYGEDYCLKSNHETCISNVIKVVDFKRCYAIDIDSSTASENDHLKAIGKFITYERKSYFMDISIVQLHDGYHGSSLQLHQYSPKGNGNLGPNFCLISGK
ncbi:MAG TPA: hypothetical protein VEU47_03810 [Candidatus Cybelea sp.]|nr:hypothetical protein [Candidatus Cybelea sp.]